VWRERAFRLLAVEGATVAVALVGLVVAFSLSSPFFLTGENIKNLLVQSIFVLLVALGMTFVLVAGGIDLSVGSVLGLSAGTTLLVLQHGAPTVVGIAAGLATGVVAGVLNGLVIAGLGISPFIVTLASLGIASGFLQVLTSKTQLTGVDSAAFAYLANGSILGIPFPVILGILVAVALELVLWRTAFGRSVFAIGINARAAHLSGIGVKRVRFGVYVLSGLLAAGAGVLLASRLNSVQPGLGGGYELTAIAAAVIGGTSIAGGRGSVWRSVVGALLLGVLNNGLQLLSVDPVWFTIIAGISIAVAAASDQAVQRLAVGRLRGAGTAEAPAAPWRPEAVGPRGEGSR
jgi:ribose transport system permease protein